MSSAARGRFRFSVAKRNASVTPTFSRVCTAMVLMDALTPLLTEVQPV